MLDKFTKQKMEFIFQERLDKCALTFDNLPKYTLRISDRLNKILENVDNVSNLLNLLK